MHKIDEATKMSTMTVAGQTLRIIVQPSQHFNFSIHIDESVPRKLSFRYISLNEKKTPNDAVTPQRLSQLE